MNGAKGRKKYSVAPIVVTYNGEWNMFDELDNWFATKAQNTQRKYRAVFYAEFCTLFRVTRDPAGAKTLQTICAGHVTRYVNWARSQPAQGGRSAMIGETVSLNTVRQKIDVLASIWEQLIALKAVEENPWKRAARELQSAKGNDRRPHQLVPFEKVAQLFNLYFFDSPGARDKALLAVLFSALRVSEAIGLRVGDVRVGAGGGMALQLRHTKRQCAEVRVVPSWAAEIISEYQRIRRAEGARDTDPLFTKYREKCPLNEPLLMRMVHYQFRKYMRLVGLPDTYSPHCARATAITLLLEKGRSHRDVMKISGHSSPAMVAHYDKMRDKGAEEVAEDLEY